MASREKRESILEEPIPKLLWNFSYPPFISYILFTLNGLLDCIFVSRGVGVNALAGVGIALSLLLIAMSIASGISGGSASIVTRALGENQTTKALQAVSSGVFLILVISFPVVIAASCFPRATLFFLGANEQIIDYAFDYFVTIAWGMGFHLLLLYGSNILAAYGHPRPDMFANIIGVLINIILNYVFIFKFSWGTFGSALATNIANFIALSYIVLFFYRTKIIPIFNRRILKPYGPVCREIGSLAFPIATLGISVLAISIYVNRYLSTHGEVFYLALANIFFRLVSGATIPYSAISQGLFPIVGYNFGNKNYHRVIKAAKTALITSCVLACLTTLMIFMYAAPILGLFSDDATLISKGAPLLKIVFSTWPFISLIVIGAGLLSAIGNSRAAMRFSIIYQIFISVMLIALLPRLFGVMGIFYHSPLVTALGGMVAGRFIFSQIKAIKKLSV